MAMLSRRRVLQSTVAIFGAASLPARAMSARPSLAKILRRHVAARGSMDAIRSISTNIEITEDGTTVTGHYAAMRAPLERMRIDVFFGSKRVYSEGLDADGAWQMPQDAAAPTPSTKGAAALHHGVVFNLRGIEMIPSLGGTLRYAGRSDVDGISYHLVEATLRDGFAATFYLDPRTWLIARRRDVRPLHPDADNTFKPMESAFGDYRPVQGVQTAFKSWSRDLALGKVVQTSSLNSIAYNAALTDAILARTANPL